MDEKILLRSFMFLPANNSKFIDKALGSDADALILDIEDSVPSEQRQSARDNIIRYHNNESFVGKNIFIRINEIGTKDFVEDITQLVLPHITGLMPSKIVGAEDIVFLDKLLNLLEMKNGIDLGTIKLAPLIETTKAIMDIQQISKASERLVALCFGGEDYLNDLGSTYTYQEEAFVLPRAMIVNAARSAGILPIDTPYLNVTDIAGFEQKEREAYKNGFAGCLILNPKQIEPANRAFSPDDEKVAYSRKVIDAVNLANSEKKSGVVMLDGVMVGPPMRKRAQAVLEQNDLINIKKQVK